MALSQFSLIGLTLLLHFSISASVSESDQQLLTKTAFHSLFGNGSCPLLQASIAGDIDHCTQMLAE